MTRSAQSSPAVEIPDLEGIPAIPRDHEGAVFNAPWEAKAFAMVVLLHQKGSFTWQEWVDTLSAKIAAVKQTALAGDEPPYYELWLSAAEELSAGKGLYLPDELKQRKVALAAEHQHP